jgi:hypothetical protein
MLTADTPKRHLGKIAEQIHFTSPHADTSRLMQNVSITEGSGCATSATIQRSQSSSDVKVGPLCIGWHWSALGPEAKQTATKKITAVICFNPAPLAKSDVSHQAI